MNKYVLFILVFFIAEILVNISWFKYLKNKFNTSEDTNETITILYFPLSVFKGLMERFILFTGLVLNFATILIVFGAVKLGTRITNNDKITNDYFLIGNFSSILLAIVYYYIFKLIK